MVREIFLQIRSLQLLQVAVAIMPGVLIEEKEEIEVDVAEEEILKADAQDLKVAAETVVEIHAVAVRETVAATAVHADNLFRKRSIGNNNVTAKKNSI